MENNIPPRRPPIPPVHTEEGLETTADDRVAKQEKRVKPPKKVKQKFELNSQTKTFIILFSGLVCLAGAVFCFIKLFL